MRLGEMRAAFHLLAIAVISGLGIFLGESSYAVNRLFEEKHESVDLETELTL